MPLTARDKDIRHKLKMLDLQLDDLNRLAQEVKHDLKGKRNRCERKQSPRLRVVEARKRAPTERS